MDEMWTSLHNRFMCLDIAHTEEVMQSSMFRETSVEQAMWMKYEPLRTNTKNGY